MCNQATTCLSGTFCLTVHRCRITDVIILNKKRGKNFCSRPKFFNQHRCVTHLYRISLFIFFLQHYCTITTLFASFFSRVVQVFRGSFRFLFRVTAIMRGKNGRAHFKSKSAFNFFSLLSAKIQALPWWHSACYTMYKRSFLFALILLLSQSDKSFVTRYSTRVRRKKSRIVIKMPGS